MREHVLAEDPDLILPVLTQHFKMLFRNLLYTGLTRARRLAVLVGTRKAMAMAVMVPLVRWTREWT